MSRRQSRRAKPKAVRPTLAAVTRPSSLAIARWARSGQLSPEQVSAIERFQLAYALWWSPPSVTASWSPTASIRTTGRDFESRESARLAAKRLLDRLDAEVFSGLHPTRRATFLAIALYDTSAEAAGNEQGSAKVAQGYALGVVSCVADLIGDALLRRKAA